VNYNIDKQVIKCENYVGGKKKFVIFIRCGVNIIFLIFIWYFIFVLDSHAVTVSDKI